MTTTTQQKYDIIRLSLPTERHAFEMHTEKIACKFYAYYSMFYNNIFCMCRVFRTSVHLFYALNVCLFKNDTRGIAKDLTASF